MKESYHFLGFPIPFLSRHPQHNKPFPTAEEGEAWRWKHRNGYVFALTMLFAGYVVYIAYYDPAVFNAPKFTPFSIVSKEQISPTSFVITLRPEFHVLNPKRANIDPYAKEWEKGTWSVEFKQPQLQIARSYTPLPPRGDLPGDLRFLIREEAGGEMSRYVARLVVGDRLELRGPHTEVELPADVEEILFLAGGTGIAPALQVAHTLLQVRKASEELPNIRILWANRRREDCIGGSELQPTASTKIEEGIIVQELRRLQDKYPNNVSVDYLVDEEGKFIDEKTISQLTRRLSDLKPQASKLLFVSGPEGFVNFFAGPKKHWDGEQLQGELGGLIGRICLRGWEVWKQ